MQAAGENHKVFRAVVDVLFRQGGASVELQEEVTLTGRETENANAWRELLPRGLGRGDIPSLGEGCSCWSGNHDGIFHLRAARCSREVPLRSLSRYAAGYA